MQKRKTKPAGFTLIELLVVIAIIAILGAVVAPKLLGNTEKARIAAANADVKSIQLQATTYQLDKTRPITSIAQLVPEYFEETPKDPWGNDYIVTPNSDGTVKISCSKLDEIKQSENNIESDTVTL